MPGIERKLFAVSFWIDRSAPRNHDKNRASQTYLVIETRVMEFGTKTHTVKSSTTNTVTPNFHENERKIIFRLARHRNNVNRIAVSDSLSIRFQKEASPLTIISLRRWLDVPALDRGEVT